jgi:hypothetical protein
MPWYTDLAVVFDTLGERVREFNWLITDLECNPLPPELREPRPAWLFAGDELCALLQRQARPVHFDWAVLTGFDRRVPVDLNHLRVTPEADGNGDLWRNEPRVQYPGATVEIVCWDTSLTLLITSDDDLTARFRNGFPEAMDLATHNENADNAS